MERFFPRSLEAAGLLAVLAASLLAASGLLSAQTAAKAPKPFQYSVTVTVKLVQVYVTGKDGRPVADLKPEEFLVTDNGRPVAVTHFEKHFLGQAAAAAAEPGPRMNRKFLLLFDLAFMDPRGILKAREAGLKFIDATLRPEDEVALMVYTPYRGLVLYEYLTLDHQRIRRLVEGLGLKRVAGRAEDLTQYLYSRDLVGERTPRADEQTPEEAFFERQARLQASRRVDEGVRLSYVDKAQDLISALDNLAAALRRLPGYKNVIFFSEGIAGQVLFGRRGGGTSGAGSTVGQFVEQMRDYDAARADTGIRAGFTHMLDEFRAANAPIFALDVSRSQAESEFGSPTTGPASAGPELAGTDSLRQAASVTGGRFYANTVSPDHIAGDIQSVTGAFYVLGYSIGETWDGKFHKIKVRVTRTGCDVVAQGGYFSPKPFKEYTGFEKLLHVTDLALSDVPQFEAPKAIPVAAAAVNVTGQTRLVAFAKARRADLADVLAGRAEAYLLLLDEAGEVSTIKRFKLDLPPDAAGKDTFFPSFLVPARPGRYQCRLVLRNMDTGSGARGSASLVVPGTPGAPFALDPPLLLTTDRRSLDLSAADEGRLSVLFGYDTETYAPLAGEAPAGLDKVFAALRFASDVPNPDIEVTASLGDAAAATAAAVPVSVVGRSEAGPTALVLAEIATGELRPGSYFLRIEAREKGKTASAVAVADLTVK
ncbi:MAG TPA: VWA domain-containing protein [Burkholderiales bacterium]|nr:VWA domain-containing protein [Burkholderiales bacterium]